MKKLLGIALGVLFFATIGFCHEVIKCHTKIIYEIFKDKFTEPIEVCYLLTTDATLYRVTSHDEYSIRFNMWDLIKTMKRNGHDFSDVLIIIHNHEAGTSRKFSDLDIQTWYNFKALGFTGNYYLFYEGNRQIYELIED